MSFLKNKKIILFFVVLLLFSPISFLSSVNASVWDWIPGSDKLLDSLITTIGYLVIRLPAFFFSFLFLIFVIFAQLLSLLSRGIMMLILSPDFITWSYTNPSGPSANPIIYEGLLSTQSLVNIILVLALIFIGIVTILGLESYNTKKLLINFVIIALLVNFAPVICGIIIDASNIIMNYFVVQISPGTGGAIGSLSNKFQNEMAWQEFETLWEKANDISISTIVSSMLTYFTLIFIYLGFALSYLLFATLFLARYLFIWLLVILSPLAFACYAIPQTQHIARKWWDTFTQWAFIGVTGGFFLYLAEKFAMLSWQPSQSIIDSQIQGLGGGDWDVLIRNIVQGTMPAIFSLFLMYIGLIMALSVNIIGAQQAISMGKKAGKGSLNATRWAGRKTGATKAIGKTFSGIGNMQYPQNKIGRGVTKGVSIAGNIATVGGLYGLKRGLGKLGNYMQTTSTVDEQRKLKEAESKMSGLYTSNPKFVESVSQSKTANREDRMAAAMIMAKEGKIDQSNKNQVDAYKEAVKSGVFDTKQAENKNPDLVRYNQRALIETGKTDLDEQIKEAKKKILNRQSAAQIAENLSKESFEDIDIVADIPLNVLANPRFSENLSQDKMDELKKFAELGSEKRKELRRKIRQLYNDGKNKEAEELSDKLTAINSL